MGVVTRTRLERLADTGRLLVEYATPRRLANVLLNEWEFARRCDILSSTPPTLTVDITNACQLRCPLCATGRGEIKRPRTLMPLARFTDLIDQVADRVFQVHLYCWGEPTLVPKLAEYIAVVRRRNLGCVIGTNLSRPLRDAEVEELAAVAPDRIVVSLDGTTADIHRQYRVGSDIEVVKDNVLRLACARGKGRRRRPRLIWQMLAFAHNAHQIPVAAGLYRSWGFDSFQVERPNLPFGIHETGLAEAWFAPDADLRVSGPNQLKDNLGAVCFWPWRVAVISPDGMMTTCCYVHDPKADLGSVLEEGFFNVWNSPKMAAVRRAVAGKGQPPYPCFECDALSK